jgi:hypothetical protein
MPKWHHCLCVLLVLLVALSFAEASSSSASSHADKARADKACDEGASASVGQVVVVGIAFLFMMALIVVAVVVVIALWWVVLLLLVVVSFAMLARSVHAPSMSATPMPTHVLPVHPDTISTTKIPELVNATLDWVGAPAELRTIMVDWVQGVPVWLIWTLLCSCFILILVWRIGHYLALDKVGRDFKKYVVKPRIQANQCRLLQFIATLIVFPITGVSFVTVIYILELPETGWVPLVAKGVAIIVIFVLISAVWTVLTPWFTYASHQMHEGQRARRQRKWGNNGQAPAPASAADPVAAAPAVAAPDAVAAVAAAP